MAAPERDPNAPEPSANQPVEDPANLPVEDSANLRVESTAKPSASQDEAEPQGAMPAGGATGMLEESALGRGMLKAGGFFKDYLNWVLIAVIGIAALTYAWRLRQQSNQQAQAAAQIELSNLRQTVDNARILRVRAPDLSEDRASTALAELETAFEQSKRVVEDAPGGASPVAHSLMGDYYWFIATMPRTLPSTRPADEFTPLPELGAMLERAAASWQAAMSNEAPASVRQKARFGLAAVAEEIGDFDAAREQYDALLDETALPNRLRNIVRSRLESIRLAGDRSPLVEPAAAATPATQPSSVSEGLGPIDTGLGGLGLTDLPGITLDESKPSTRPATQPALPTP